MKLNIFKKYRRYIILVISLITAFLIGFFTINLIKIHKYRNQIHEGVLICLEEKNNIKDLEKGLAEISNKYNSENEITFNFNIKDLLGGQYMVYSIIAGKEFKDIFVNKYIY